MGHETGIALLILAALMAAGLARSDARLLSPATIGALRVSVSSPQSAAHDRIRSLAACRERSRTSHRALTLHHCQRCGGVWFDRAVGLAHSGSAAIDVVGGAAEGVFDAVIAIIESLFNE